MRYFEPQCEPVVAPSAADSFVEKFGGVAFGYDEATWPRCAVKGQSELNVGGQ